ncbi:hypothetical protein D9M68_917290 [compost metagenome]
MHTGHRDLRRPDEPGKELAIAPVTHRDGILAIRAGLDRQAVRDIAEIPTSTEGLSRCGEEDDPHVIHLLGLINRL